MKKYCWSFLVSRIKIGDEWVIYNWLNGENATLNDVRHPVYQFLDNKSEKIPRFLVNGEFTEFDYLVKNKFLVESQDLVRAEVRIRFAEITDASRLGLILMPANQGCNFRCTYCWEDHTRDNMMGDLEHKALCAYIASKPLALVHVDYFGGEPLLNMPFIKRFNGELIKIADKNSFKLDGASMTTNGYLLTKNDFLALHAAGVNSYQITLDGEANHHNNLRTLINGYGTHAVIYKNLLDMASTDKNFCVTLRINFDPISALPENRTKFLEQLARDFASDSRFMFNSVPVTRLIGSVNQDKKFVCCGEAERVNVKKEFEDEAESFGLKTLQSALVHETASHFCYAGRYNSFIAYPFDEQERIPLQKCTFCLGSSHNVVGYLKSNGDLIKNDNWSVWARDNLFKHEKCKKCFFVLQCFGNSCAHRNIVNGKISCPDGKEKEHLLVERVMRAVNAA